MLNYLFSFLLSILALSCSLRHEQEIDLKSKLFNDILSDSLGVKTIPNHIIFLSNHGCFHCNQKVANIMSELNNKNLL